MTRQHFTAGLLFGGATAITTWAVAYATNQH